MKNQEIFRKSIEKSHSYIEYRTLLKSLLSQGKSSGSEQSEALLHYSELNDTRMNRLDKTISIPTENVEKLKQLENEQIWLVISEGWCGDAAQILPVINKMAEQNTKINLRIVFRDENDELMQLFLTNGTRSIPKLIVLDKDTLEFITDFGPRPNAAKKLILDYKAQHGIVDETAKTELQLWYLHDKGLSTQNEILEAIETKLLSQKSLE
ncbi:thioredoxin family protein [Flavobacterium sp.]|uniref:thioredoxin family protein n=1 Tax=Flavobacterium sp. TaxID=239 RepID=UPI0035B0E63D